MVGERRDIYDQAAGNTIFLNNKLSSAVSKVVLCVLFTSLTVLTSFSQIDWEFQNPLPQGNDLRSVSFCDENNGWAAGLAGALLHTTNGGTTWALQDISGRYHFWGVACLSTTTAVAVGESGKIFRTTDGGSTWTEIQSNTTNLLGSLCFVDDMVGYAFTPYAASGSELVKTIDGGVTWTLSTIGITEQITGAHFANADTGYFTVGGFSAAAIYKTIDGGVTWTPEVIPTVYGLNAVFAFDSVAWAVGYNGVIIKTKNQGSVWITIAVGGVGKKELYAVNFSGSSIGFVAGEHGETKRSTDGGYSWTTIMTDFQNTKTIRHIQMVDNNYGYAVGEKGKIMKTSDQGVNWNHLDNALKPKLFSVWFTDTLNGTAVGDSATGPGGWSDGKIYTTTDGGSNWNLSYTKSNATFQAVHYPTATNGFAVGSSGNKAIVAKTTDGGASWTSQDMFNFKGKMWSVFFHDASSGIAVGDSGMVYTTSNGGNAWTKRNTGTLEELYSVYFDTNLTSALPADTGYIGFITGDSGTFLMSKDMGVTWTAVTSPTLKSINDVYILPRKAIWLAAGSNEIYKSTVAGSFVKQTLPTLASTNWADIYSIDENYVCAIGGYGNIVFTTDGGTTWIQQKRTSNILMDVHFENPDKGWIVGEGGTILHTIGSNITGIGPKRTLSIPGINTLAQNYPNPFSSATSIRFVLPSTSDVTIKIYDMMGREVTTLVNERLIAGAYQCEWSPEGVEGGIYLYRISASLMNGKQVHLLTQTKKLMLIK